MGEKRTNESMKNVRTDHHTGLGRRGQHSSERTLVFSNLPTEEGHEILWKEPCGDCSLLWVGFGLSRAGRARHPGACPAGGWPGGHASRRTGCAGRCTSRPGTAAEPFHNGTAGGNPSTRLRRRTFWQALRERYCQWFRYGAGQTTFRVIEMGKRTLSNGMVWIQKTDGMVSVLRAGGRLQHSAIGDRHSSPPANS